MNPLAIAKTVGAIVASVGTGAVVGNAIKASTPTGAKIVQKIVIGVGGFILSGMVGDMAAKYATDNIDRAAKEFKEAKEKAVPSITDVQ